MHFIFAIVFIYFKDKSSYGNCFVRIFGISCIGSCFWPFLSLNFLKENIMYMTYCEIVKLHRILLIEKNILNWNWEKRKTRFHENEIFWKYQSYPVILDMVHFAIEIGRMPFILVDGLVSWASTVLLFIITQEIALHS